jgi:hypothetical protein
VKDNHRSSVGATFATLPAAAAALSVATAQYWYASGVYYAMQNGKYVRSVFLQWQQRIYEVVAKPS